MKRFAPAIIIGFVLLLRAPFLNQAIQGDDVYYLAGAQHAQIDPAHPNHAKYYFLGDLVDMRGHSHPPGNSWILGALLAIFGETREVWFHAAYVVFSAIAALSMLWLAGRFTERPLEATLLFCVAPIFVVNGNSLEADLPFLAFWMASVAAFVRGRLALSALASALAALTAYQAIFLTPVLAAWLWFERDRRKIAWLATLAAPAALAIWQLYERASGGALPAGVLTGYLSSYGFQAAAQKLRNAAALLAHLPWIAGPLIGGPRWLWLAGVPAALVDWHPLFWASFAAGIVILWRCAKERFLGAWVLIFFAGACAVFFAGSARYLLPVAAPLAILASRSFSRWRMATLGALAVALAAVNYMHWDAYRDFARSLAKESSDKRVWINASWGLQFYLESEGGLPMPKHQIVRPGDMVVSSALALPVPFGIRGGAATTIREQEIRPWIPARLISLGGKSGYSVASNGLRPFDVSRGPIDRVKAELIIERRPEREFVEIKNAGAQIVAGIFPDGWMSEQGSLLLKKPAEPLPLRVRFFIPPQAPGRTVRLLLNGQVVAEAEHEEPGSYSLVTAPLAPEDDPLLTITIDRTFRVPPDQRALGMILIEAGFRR